MTAAESNGKKSILKTKLIIGKLVLKQAHIV